MKLVYGEHSNPRQKSEDALYLSPLPSGTLRKECGWLRELVPGSVTNGRLASWSASGRAAVSGSGSTDARCSSSWMNLRSVRMSNSLEE